MDAAVERLAWPKTLVYKDVGTLRAKKAIRSPVSGERQARPMPAEDAEVLCACGMWAQTTAGVRRNWLPSYDAASNRPLAPVPDCVWK